MEELKEIYYRLLEKEEGIYIRSCYQEFQFDGRLMGITGPRGVGKTTFLLHYLSEQKNHLEQALYVSADHLYFVENKLLDLVDRFVKESDGTLIAIDEIHKYKNWNQELKNIYDAYPNIRILFSGSSALDLIHGKYDLSRRAILYQMSGFSFREYLEYALNKKINKYSLKEIVTTQSKVSNELSSIPRLIGHFKEYLQMGYYPFFKEYKELANYHQALMNTVEKTIYEDIASFYSLRTQNLEILKKIIYFIATSKPGSVNVNKLAKSLGKDNTTISEYLQMLKNSGLLEFLLNDKMGHALVRNAEKMYLQNTNLQIAINKMTGKEFEIGSLRELFVINQLTSAGHVPLYSKKGDLVCEKMTFEIGGKNKDTKQITGVSNSYLIKDDILIGNKQTIPIFYFGFLS